MECYLTSRILVLSCLAIFFNSFVILILFSNFHFVHEFVTILMDSAILYFRILPWFWKVSDWAFLLRSRFCLSAHCWLRVSFLIADITRLFDIPWSQCREWNISHTFIFSRSYGLVTGAYEYPFGFLFIMVDTSWSWIFVHCIYFFFLKRIFISTL